MALRDLLKAQGASGGMKGKSFLACSYPSPDHPLQMVFHQKGMHVRTKTGVITWRRGFFVFSFSIASETLFPIRYVISSFLAEHCP